MKLFREKLIEYGTYFIAFLLPVLYFGSSRYLSYTTSKTFFFYGCVEVIFSFWLYTLFVDKRYRLSKRILWMFFPFVALVFSLTLSGVFGVNPELSFWSSLGRGTGLLTLYHILAMSLIVASLVKLNSISSYTKKLLVSFVSGAFILIISIWLSNEGFNLPADFLQKSKGGGLIGNSSLSATYLIFTSFLSLFLIFQKDSSKRLKIFLWSFVAIVLFSPLFVNVYSYLSGNGLVISARGAMIGIIFGGVVSSLGYLALSKQKTIRVLSILSIVFSTVVFSILWVNLLKPETRIHKKVSESISESRFIFWDIAGNAIKEKPILGWGPENYPVVYQKYFDPNLYLQSDTTVETWNDRAHNIIFDIGVSGGYVAVILYVVFLVSIVYGIYKAFTLGKITSLQASVLWGLLGAYFFQNLFVFDSFVSLAAVGIFFGFIFGLNNEEVNEKKINFKNKNILALGIILIFAPIWFYCAWMPARKAEAFAKVVAMPLNIRSDHYGDLLKGSAVGNSFEISSLADDAYKLYSGNKNQILSNPELLKYSQIDLDKFLAFLEIVSKEEPYDYRLHLSMIRLYNLQISFSGKKVNEELLQHILNVGKIAQDLSPNDPQIDWSLAQTFALAKDYRSAEQALEHSISIAPNIPWSYKFLIKFAKDTNNQELYDKILLDAYRAIPSFSLE